MSPVRAGTTYDYKTKEIGRISGSQTSAYYRRDRVMPEEGRRMHSNTLPEDIFTVPRDGGTRWKRN
ncbi:hypothetical protein NSB25_28655 [Acetatifactor muris]|uniref:hypothetical protein n=1 Tax=Acetatifactor muris TaxID=879566 RepID=UPI000CD0F11E|nr:hypothetical protein [Acetatifactor muris]MCR2051185.1 hypothetical protein [Acetatifactor muris]